MDDIQMLKIPPTRGHFNEIYIFYSDSPCFPRFHPIKRLVSLNIFHTENCVRLDEEIDEKFPLPFKR